MRARSASGRYLIGAVFCLCMVASSAQTITDPQTKTDNKFERDTQPAKDGRSDKANSLQAKEKAAQGRADLSKEQKAKLDAAIDAEVSQRLHSEVFPASLEQIEQLSKRSTDVRKAMRAGSKPTAVPVFRSLMAELSGRESPQAIRIEWGMTTTVAFFDAYGNPWPIVFSRSGDDAVAKIGPEKKEERVAKAPNFLTVEVGGGEGRFRNTNLTVLLESQKAPLVFWLLPNQAQVDFRVDVTVPTGTAPGAKAPEVQSVAYDQVLLQAGNNTLPKSGMKTVKVLSDPGNAIIQVIEVGEHLIVTSRVPLIAPAPLAATTTTDGRNVYRISKTPILSVAVNGAIEFVRLEL